MGSLGWAQCHDCFGWEFNMYIPDGIGYPLCEMCMESYWWAQCFWCWKWQYHCHFPVMIQKPFCTRCFIALGDGEEAPWWPNGRKRLELVLLRLSTPLPDDLLRQIAELARPGYIP